MAMENCSIMMKGNRKGNDACWVHCICQVFGLLSLFNPQNPESVHNAYFIDVNTKTHES